MTPTRSMHAAAWLRVFCFATLMSLVAGAAFAGDVRRPSFPSEPEIGDPNAAPKGFVLVEGDMLVPEDELGKAGGYEPNLWPGGEVPYLFSGNLNQSRRDTVLAAMAIVESVANVDFRPLANDFDFVLIQWDSTNTNATLGHVGGLQTMNVADWATMWNLVHELFHTLGIVHEHTRADRNTYVSVDFSQVSQVACGGGPCDSNFTINNNAEVYGYYDFASIMHYGPNAFAIGSQPTITCVAPYTAFQSVIGQRGGLSELDVLTVSFLYPEPDWRFVDGTNFIPIVELGLFAAPWSSFVDGTDFTPTGGTLWVQPGDYGGVGVYDRELEIRAPLGGVVVD